MMCYQSNSEKFGLQLDIKMKFNSPTAITAVLKENITMSWQMRKSLKNSFLCKQGSAMNSPLKRLE